MAALAGTIVEAFGHAARAQPGAAALLCGEDTVSYAELERWSAAIASGLRDRGVGRGDRVGLYLPRSPAAIAALLGILRAGAAYVPFDTGYPLPQLRLQYQDAAPALMVMGSAQAFGQPRFWSGAEMALGESPPGILGPTESPDPLVQPEDAAYVLYTSGSTGRPKGVVVPHRAVLRLVLDCDFAELGPAHTLLQLAPLSFDASTFEIWGALLTGGRLALPCAGQVSLDEIGAAISQHGVTTLWLTAGLFHLMVEHRLDALRPLRQLLAGGDVLSPAHVRRALKELPGCRLINGYGPTENTTFSCCYTVPADTPADAPVPIGAPIAGTEAHVLDAALRPVGDGEEGELYVGGRGLALGYLGSPELTAERFIPHPFAAEPGARLYRTGDLVRRRPDGNFDFLGRADRQIKINGKRVELDGIEACLRRCPGVAEAAVVCEGSVTDQRRIAAFAAPSRGRVLSADELRMQLRLELPDYMVPATIRVLQALPLTPTGKIDRGALPRCAEPGPAPCAAPPAGEMQSALLQIWRQVLGRHDVGIDANFFDLGGSSLQLIRAHALIQAGIDRGLPLVDLFAKPSIRSLAAHLAARRNGTAAAGADATARARQQAAAYQRMQRPGRSPQ